jgi:hypothetical protein
VLKYLLACLTLQVSPLPFTAAESPGVRGNAAAVEAARRLLEQVGGAEIWRARTFVVTERIYLASGETGELCIVRDLALPARLTEGATPTRRYRNWVSPDGGWARRNDVVTVMSPENLATELQGVRQDLYTIYHRLAHEDPTLRVELMDNGTLRVFDRDERLLSWFVLAPNGVLLGWGSMFDGAINQHFYGPLVDVGDANLPKFVVRSDGSYRFEYLSARLTNEVVEAPDSSGEYCTDTVTHGGT